MFNVVLVEPEIPSNTGNIGRLCVATKSTLHLVKPLGFELSDKQLKRAGLDYWSHLHYQQYENYEQWVGSHKNWIENKRCFFFSTKAKKELYSASFKEGDFFIFGSETCGLNTTVLEQNADSCFRIPMSSSARSLNLSNAVSIVVYEALRQVLSESPSPHI